MHIEIVKQMKIIHDNGYSEDEKIMFRMLAHSNAIQSLFIILQNMDLLSVTYKDKVRIFWECHNIFKNHTIPIWQTSARLILNYFK